MRRFLEALQFLTVLPVPRAWRKEAPENSLASAASFFPLVGVLVGVLSYFVFWLASFCLPWRVSILILLFFPILLSGGLHMDGLSDFCDGFFSARSDREEVLRIMKDSRIGVMGTLGLIFVLLVKYELLVILARNGFLIIFMLAASRTVHVILAYFLDYVGGSSGMGKSFVGQIAKKDLRITLGISILLGLPLGLSFTCVESVFLVLFLWALAQLVKKRIGGVTGDVLGAAGELSEVLILAVAAWILPS